MRFFSDGPNIPDLLLERRDQGRVVFICGAGVSVNAGMPDFLDLTKYVVEFFDPPATSEIAKAFNPWLDENTDGPKVPFDQIFHLLYQEYGRDDVNALVEERLREKDTRIEASREHKLIAKLSSDQAGKPQIVTTNFDRLFEQTLDTVPDYIFEPPAFPDINLGMPLTGITYLHGRLQEPAARHFPYVLSSADFGRAYLSEGWATNFIRSLLEHYTVVLVGYQAEDPPVKYLLQGLNHDEMSDRSNLYAFDLGLPEEVEAKWRDRGVTPIAYNDHADLWKSFEAWAERADDPRQWRTNIVELAMNGPRQLEAHERGQVAHLVCTTPGARLFANTDPSPPTEWLCVFDAFCRAAQESSGHGEDAETFDPLETYGLDDDPPRPPKLAQRSTWIHDHILEWRKGDTNPPGSHKLCNRQLAGHEDMPPRLFHLSRWIAKHLNNPVTAWWALRQNGLHPRLTNYIDWELRRNKELHSKALHIWNLILEYQISKQNFSADFALIHLKDRIKNEGWSASVLKNFEETTTPRLTRDLPSGIAASKPPFENWDEITYGELTSWKVKFPDQHGEKIDIPDEVLEHTFRIFEDHLRRATRLLRDIESRYYTIPTCYPEREVDGQKDYHSKGDIFFKWFLELFARMVTQEPTITRAHAIIWPSDDKYFFRKLKLFALNHAELFEADEAAEIVLAFDQGSFWDTKVCRELLFLLQDRWEDFSETNRIALAERLLNGPEKMEHWSDGEYPDRRNEIACRYIKWLTINGRLLSKGHATRLDTMVSGLSEWNDGWASGFITEHYGSSGWVGTDDKPDTIINLPVNEIIEQARIDSQRDIGSFTNKQPFVGLVKANPRKALASLSHSARKGDYPQAFWTSLINEWPEKTKPRLYCAFLHRLYRLPEETIRELHHTIGEWVKTRFLSAYQVDEELAWKIFDHLVSGLSAEDGVATTSGIGETRVGGTIVHKSRRTFDHAINGPIGKATEGLIHTLDFLKLDQNHGIPEEFKERMELLLSASGEGGDHAVTILTHQISWLYYLDPEWVMKRLMPWFSFDHPSSEPAWNGYLSAAKFPPQKIGEMLKPQLLELFPTIYGWSWGSDLAMIATQIIVGLGIFRGDYPDGLNPNEVRHCLRKMNDKNRRDAVTRLGHIGQREENGWSEYVIPFINTVWPRERAFRTSTLVLSWASLLDDTGDNFPAVLSAVRRFLVPVEDENHSLYRFSKDINDEPLTSKYPESVLEFLDAIIPNNADNAPYDLPQILELIEETDSSLVRDRRFLRLIDLVEQR